MKILVTIVGLYVILSILTFGFLILADIVKSFAGYADERASPKENLNTALGLALIETPIAAFVWHSLY